MKTSKLFTAADSGDVQEKDVVAAMAQMMEPEIRRIVREELEGKGDDKPTAKEAATNTRRREFSPSDGFELPDDEGEGDAPSQRGPADRFHLPE